MQNAQNKTPKKLAKDMLEEIWTLNTNNAQNIYKMATLLNGIKQAQLWEVLGYSGFAQMFSEGAMPFTKYMGESYASLIYRSKELGYNKSEVIKALESITPTALAKQLKADTKKTSVSSLVKRSRAKGKSRMQLNFNYMDEADLEIVEAALEKFGMEKDVDGYRHYSSESLLELCRRCK